MPKVSDVLARVRDIISDPNERRWQDDELLRWVDDAQRLIVQVKPEINAEFIELTLADGARQRLHDRMARLIDIPLLTEVDKDWLDQYLPTWQTSSSSNAPYEYMRDPDKRVFYVYPPAIDGAKVTLHVGMVPATIEANDDELVIESEHIRAVAEFVCYKALSKDSTNPMNKELADGYLAQFYSSLGVTVETEDGRG
jgi:hypothetical protein